MVTDMDDLRATRPIHPPAVSLAEVGSWLRAHDAAAHIRGDAESVVSGVTLSSRRVLPGDLYAALPGQRAHGIDFLEEAMGAGAAAVITDAAGAERVGSRVPVVSVESPRALLGGVGPGVRQPGGRAHRDRCHRDPGQDDDDAARRGRLHPFRDAGGGDGHRGDPHQGPHRPDRVDDAGGPDLHGLFARMRDEGVRVCFMEVSSHALVMGRVDGLVFDVAVFTNLGRDHLDFHRDLDDYFAAKAALFTPERARRALVNAQDEHGRRLLERAVIPTRGFAVSGPADWRAERIEASATGSAFDIVGPDIGPIRSRVGLPGAFNVGNALAALAGCAEAGLELAPIAGALGEESRVPGRFERIDEGQDFAVVVDYAHKPDALSAALGTLRPLTDRLILVVGAGGDRDRGKRPLMGEIGGRLADVLVVTDDNPRGEDPAAIRRELLAGAADATAQVIEIGDRRAAIRRALQEAAPGAIVVIAGKGHESGQEVAGRIHPFDDRTVAHEELRHR